MRLIGEDGVSVRRGVAVHEKHSLTACAFAQPKNGPCVILRGAHTIMRNTTRFIEPVHDRGERLGIIEGNEGGGRARR